MTASLPVSPTETETFVSNIAVTARNAIEAGYLAEGVLWYENYRWYLSRWGDLTRMAGIFAALSPQKSISENTRLFIRGRANGRNSGHTDLFCGKADAIAEMEDISHDAIHRVLARSLVKTPSFFQNLIGNETEFVTIDRHAVAVAYNRSFNRGDAAPRLQDVKIYNIFRDAYIEAASIISDEIGHVITPAQLQAIVWVYWRTLPRRTRRG